MSATITQFCGSYRPFRRRFLKLGLVTVGVLILPRTLRAYKGCSIASPYAPDSIFQEWIDRFAIRANELDSDAEFQIFPGGQLGNSSDLLNAIRVGALEMALLPADVIAGVAPLFGSMSLPTAVPNTETAEFLLSDESQFRPILQTAAAAAGFKVLSLGWTFWSLGGKGQFIRRPGDLDGRSVRSNRSYLSDVISASGGETIFLAFSDFESAIQTGLVDTGITSLAGWTQIENKEGIDYVTWSPDRWLFNTGYALIMALDAFESLSSEQRMTLQNAGRFSEDFFLSLVKEVDEDDLGVLVENGVEIVPIEDEEFTQWRDISRQAVWTPFAQSVEGADSLVNELASIGG